MTPLATLATLVTSHDECSPFRGVRRLFLRSRPIEIHSVTWVTTACLNTQSDKV